MSICDTAEVYYRYLIL